jgi:hypothetical protein
LTTLDAGKHSSHRSAPEMHVRTAAKSTRLELQVRRQLLICLSLLYTTILFSTLALPGGAKQVPLSFLTGLLHFGLLAVLTRFAFNPFRLLAVCAALAVIALETALFHREYSPASLLYVAAIYLPLALTLPLLDASAVRTIWKHVSILSMAAAVCGLVQLVGQLLSSGMFLDPIRLLPQAILFQGYNTTYPVFYGGSLLKPNGMFLLEPSYFSQLVAMGLVSELVFFHRKWRIAVLITALAFSFSGTGILILLPALLFIGSSRVIVSFALFATALAAVMIVLGFGEFFADRAAETGQTGSSGNERFVAPYVEIVQEWSDSTMICLFGKGAGSSERMSTAVETAFGAIPKVGLEYGLVGLSAFAIVWFTMFFGLAVPRAMTVMLLILYFVSTSSFLQAFTVFEIWAMTGGFLRRSATTGTTMHSAASSDTFPGAKQRSLPLATQVSAR